MATKRILKLTNQEAIVKVDGAIGTVSIDLATDLKLATEDITTPTVNIVQMFCSGQPNAVMSVARNSVNLWDLQANASSTLNLLEMGGASDSTNNTSNVDVTIAGAEGQIILKLRKVSGYQTKIRSAETGSDTPV